MSVNLCFLTIILWHGILGTHRCFVYECTRLGITNARVLKWKKNIKEIPKLSKCIYFHNDQNSHFFYSSSSCEYILLIMRTFINSLKAMLVWFDVIFFLSCKNILFYIPIKCYIHIILLKTQKLVGIDRNELVKVIVMLESY